MFLYLGRRWVLQCVCAFVHVCVCVFMSLTVLRVSVSVWLYIIDIRISMPGAGYHGGLVLGSLFIFVLLRLVPLGGFRLK